MIVPASIKFLVTTQPKYELDAASEVWHCIYATGIPENEIKVDFIRRKYRLVAGLIAISFESDSLYTAEQIRFYLQKHPWILRYTHRIIPVELATDNFDIFVQKLTSLANNRILNDETWRISLSKHASKIRRNTVIESIASEIHTGRVSLKDYKWIINVEIIGDTYIGAVIRPHHIINRKEFITKIKHTPVLEYYNKD